LLAESKLAHLIDATRCVAGFLGARERGCNIPARIAMMAMTTSQFDQCESARLALG